MASSTTGEALRHPQSSASSRVTQETVEGAVNALLKWKDSKSKTQKPQLLEQDDFIYLVLTLKKIPPKSRTNAYKIALPHPLHSSSSTDELCLIIDDRPRQGKQLTSDDAKKKIKSEDIPISKVVKLSKLKSDYKPFEAKRKLCGSYDMFFADKRVVPLLPKLLGNQFFKKKKIPVPVDLTHNNWKEQIEKACSSALLYLRTGTCSVVRVGKVSMESGEIVENVIAAINGAVEAVVPKKWAGLRSLNLKFSESVALPIYQALPDMKLKIEGLLEKKKNEKEESVGGELEEIKENSTGKKDKKLGCKKKGSSSKKGRIHEVQYMDTTDIDQKQEMGSDDDKEDGYGSEQSRDGELGSADNEGKKKRKQADHQVISELKNFELKCSKKLAKVENGDRGEHKKGGLSILKDGEESGGMTEKKKKKREESGGRKEKKKKSGLGKLKDGTMKVKVKKSSRKKQSV